MSRPAADYLVYSCGACSKRIFTERSHLGRTGTCPCCGERHVVGGVRVAAEGEERRGAPRVTGDERARVGVVSQEDLMPLRDLSTTGIGFLLPGRGDAPPPQAAVGEVLEITLHAPQADAPRTYRAEVRRVEAAGRGQWTVGAKFVGLDANQEAELRQLLDDLSR